MMRHALWVSFVIVAGCADLPEIDESDVTSRSTWDPDNGRHILGSYADTLAAGPYFRVSATPVYPSGFQLSVNDAGQRGVNGTHLVATHATGGAHSGADPWFVGMIMGDGTGHLLRIRRVEPTVTDTGIASTLYYLDHLGPDGQGTDYCGGQGGAIPLAGYYGDARIHRAGPWISFACRDGAARKCNRWGYVAGNAGPGDPNWDRHQGCTAMANADYCRTGVPYTLNETPIQIRDFVPDYAQPEPIDLTPPDVFPGDRDKFYFEAVWRPGELGPVCLSRFRWVGLAPDECQGVVPDPRITLKAKFCDDLTLAEQEGAGAFLVSGSRIMDLPLLRWRNPSTDDVVETVRGYSFPTQQRPPFADYTEYLGADSMLLRNLPGTFQEKDMFVLNMQHNPATDDRVVAPDGLLPGYAPISAAPFEGYAFRSQVRTELVPLQLCNIGADYRATIAPPPGCTNPQTIGYVLPMP